MIRSPRAPRADHMTFAKGRYRVPKDEPTVNLFVPLKGTGVIAASSNMKVARLYDDDTSETICIGFSNKYIPTEPANDLKLYDRRHMDRDIAPIIKAELLDVVNLGASDIEDGEETRPITNGIAKWEAGKVRTGPAQGPIPTGCRGYIQVRIDNTGAM